MDSLSHQVYKSLEIKKKWLSDIYTEMDSRIQRKYLLCPNGSFVSFTYLHFLCYYKNLSVMDWLF